MHLADMLPDETAVDGDITGLDVTAITADSRLVEPGALFAAMPGSVVDGARFIGQAVAACSVVDGARFIGQAVAAGAVAV